MPWWAHVYLVIGVWLLWQVLDELRTLRSDLRIRNERLETEMADVKLMLRELQTPKP